ncbi:hypothetical protein [Pedobacter miscanthi]|jgi:hypothetical protein|uniref:hypothetical protein n=1 Tax=Pedobacter miscanthi TaxID=2259170 RepID=UPI0029305B4E|nr:hypothetical protein [Pedobacter miscanthi]
MNHLYEMIKGDYLQRSRSYAFLITLAVTIYAAYTFVPTPEAAYTTLTIPGYKGAYNSAWVGHVTALMSTVILSLCGFFLVNNGIKKDIETEVGLIIATTPISNLGYLLMKFLSNLLLLLTIAFVALLVSIMMFFIQRHGYAFHLADFLLPYLFMLVPTMVLLSGCAIMAEVFLNGKSVLQCIIYFFIFIAFIVKLGGGSKDLGAAVADGFGMREIVNSILYQVNTQFNENIKGFSIGYATNAGGTFKIFVWNGVHWSGNYLLSRVIWIMISMGMVYLSSLFFHRFDFKQTSKSKRSEQRVFTSPITTTYSGFNKSILPVIAPAYGIFPLIKTELLLMLRKDNKWLWVVNIGLWVAMLFVPIHQSYFFLLPILLFLQVNRISDLSTRESTYRLHYFTYAAYKPLQRILPSQIIAGLLLLMGLSIPVICRLLIDSEYLSALQVINGALMVILFSVCLGIVNGSKKLFEILFFMFTYVVLQTPKIHYLGAVAAQERLGIFITVLGINILLLLSSFLVRSRQIRHL